MRVQAIHPSHHTVVSVTDKEEAAEVLHLIHC
jgi:hypothetical protein